MEHKLKINLFPQRNVASVPNSSLENGLVPSEVDDLFKEFAAERTLLYPKLASQSKHTFIESPTQGAFIMSIFFHIISIVDKQLNTPQVLFVGSNDAASGLSSLFSKFAKQLGITYADWTYCKTDKQDEQQVIIGSSTRFHMHHTFNRIPFASLKLIVICGLGVALSKTLKSLISLKLPSRFILYQHTFEEKDPAYLEFNSFYPRMEIRVNKKEYTMAGVHHMVVQVEKHTSLDLYRRADNKTVIQRIQGLFNSSETPQSIYEVFGGFPNMKIMEIHADLFSGQTTNTVRGFKVHRRLEWLSKHSLPHMPWLPSTATQFALVCNWNYTRSFYVNVPRRVHALVSIVVEGPETKNLKSQIPPDVHYVTLNEVDKIKSILKEPSSVFHGVPYRYKSFGLEWKQLRVVLIGWMKENYPECAIAGLPLDVLREIVALCAGR